MNHYFIDTHCHLAYMVGKPDAENLTDTDMQAIAKIVEQACAAGVTRCITVGTNHASSRAALAIAACVDGVYATAAMHPSDEHDAWRDEMVLIDLLVKQRGPKLIAVGECGLDYHYPNYNKIRQQELFAHHIELAIASGLPLVIHSRDAIDDTLAVLDRYAHKTVRGVFHCFSENGEYARQIVDRGFLLGIGAPITYPKNNTLREVVHTIGLEHLVLETDAPFLPPQSKRGQQNSPIYIPLVAEAVAVECGVPVERVAAITTHNAEKLFSF